MHLHFLVCRLSLKAESDLRACLQGLTEAWQKDSACVLCLLSLNECISQLVSILGSALNSSPSPHWGDEPKQTFQGNQLDWTEEKEGKLQPADDVRQTGLSFPVQTQLCNKNASISQITPLPWPCTWYKSDGPKIPPSVLISILCIGPTFVLRSNVSIGFLGGAPLTQTAVHFAQDVLSTWRVGQRRLRWIPEIGVIPFKGRARGDHLDSMKPLSLVYGPI